MKYNLYQYGSKVYGTFTDKSDEDYIAVFDYQYHDDHYTTKYNIDINLLTPTQFQYHLNNHEISILEVYFSNPLNEDYTFEFVFDMDKLRRNISAKASNSYSKFKKKLRIEKDYNPYIAKKSLWHSIRIIMFGIQLAKYKKIIDYTEANCYYDDILSMPDDWKVIDEKYKPILNKLKSEFRIHCPKEL